MDYEKRKFYTTANASQLRGSRTFLKNHRLKYMGSYWLTDSDKKELKSIIPSFQLAQFHSWMFVGGSVPSYQNELIFWPFTYFGSFGQPGIPVMYFTCESQKIKKYNEWLETDKRIFMKPYIKTIPKPLTFCEELFDKNVLEIKKLVKDIGDLTPLIHKEQKNFFYMMIAILLLTTFFTEVNKNIIITMKIL